MAKRFSNFHGVTPQIGKRPKLDISINNPRFNLPLQNQPINLARTTVGQQKKNDSPIHNIWDDDDDDVILLASQAVEAIEQHSQQIIVEQQQHSFNLDVTFGKFGEGIQTSTQVVRQEKLIHNNNQYSGFEDDDGLFSEIDEYRIDGQPEKRKDSDNVFKIPTTTTVTTTTASVGVKQSKSNNDPFPVAAPSPPPSQRNHETRGIASTSKKKDPKDIQMEYLQTRLDCFRKENEKLTRDISEYNDKFQTKDGEVSVLRYEIRNLKQINDKLRLEKMQANENVKKEWQDKIHELEKLLSTQQCELQFKNAEIQNLKSKQLNATQQHINDTSISAVQSIEGQKQNLIKSDLMSSLYNLHLSEDDNLKEVQLKFIPHIPSEIFDNTKFKRFSLGYRENIFLEELNSLQDILAQIQNCKILDEISIEKFKSRILESLKKSLPQLRDYVKNLKYPRFRDTSALIEYKFLCQQISEPASEISTTIFANSLLFPEEKGFIIRRYFGALALLFECLGPKVVAEIMITEKLGEYNLLQILTESVELIGFSKELYYHFGLIESFGFLLKTFMKINQNEYDLINFIKYLIFCRPNIRPLVPITESLNILSQNSKNLSLLNLLCQKNYNGIFTINDYYKILQFSPNSCILQVYGCLLEVAFKQYSTLKQQQINSLTIICYNHIKFLHNCIELKVNWIQNSKKITEIIIDGMQQDNKEGSTSINDDQHKICDCYTRISTSFIILFHLILKHWINDANCIDFRKISKISRLGILLLCNICKLNYRREIIQIGGSIIKNRIKVIYDWLNEHKNLLQFQSAHCHALELIRTSHIMADQFNNFEETVNQQNQTTTTITNGEKIWSECAFAEFI